MEKLYHDLSYTKLNSVEDLLAFYRQRWEQEWKDEIIIVRKEYAPDHYRGVGERCINDYYRRFVNPTRDVHLQSRAGRHLS